MGLVFRVQFGWSLGDRFEFFFLRTFQGAFCWQSPAACARFSLGFGLSLVVDKMEDCVRQSQDSQFSAHEQIVLLISGGDLLQRLRLYDISMSYISRSMSTGLWRGRHFYGFVVSGISDIT